MANTTIYIIDATDGSDNFAIQPRTFDGIGGVQQHTDITLYGNATANWGEKFNENFYRLVENFAVHQQEPGDPNYSISIPRPKSQYSNIDSTLPDAGSAMDVGSGINSSIAGQIWFNKTDQKLYVCSIGGFPGVASWKTIGAGTSQPPNPTVGDLWYDTATFDLKAYNGTTFISAAGNFIQRSGDSMDLNANITFDGGEVLGLPNIPSGDTAAASKKYVDDKVDIVGAVLKTGSTMNLNANITFNGGEVLGLPATPSGDTAAASKEYVDSFVSGAGFVNITGDTMTGALNIADTNSLPSFTGVHVSSVGGSVIKLSNTTLHTYAPALVLYNPDNDENIAGSVADYGYLRIANRDADFITIEADKDDIGAAMDVNTLSVLHIQQTGELVYNGNGTNSTINMPNSTIASIDTDLKNVVTKEYVDDKIAGSHGLVHIETLHHTTYYDVNSSTYNQVPGLAISYTTPASLSNFTFTIKASLLLYLIDSKWPTYWQIRSDSTTIDTKVTEGNTGYKNGENVTLMGSGTLSPNTTYTFSMWVRNSTTDPTQDTRLNANNDFETGGDTSIPPPQSTMELMVFG